MRSNTPPHLPEILNPDQLDDLHEDDSEIDEEVDMDSQDDSTDDNAPQNGDQMLDVLRIEDVEDVFAGEVFPSDSDDDDGYGEEEDDEAPSPSVAAGFPNHPMRDDARVTFHKHSAPVFACAVHPHRDWAATGGEDDRAYIWNRSTGDEIFEISDHKDTVTAVDFNHDGTLVATGDMAGDIMVHKMFEDGPSSSDRAKLQLRKVWEYSMGDMLWMRFHPASNVLMAGAEKGEIYVWRVPNGDTKILVGQGSRCESSQLTTDGRKLLTGYESGLVRLWDIRSCQSLMEFSSSHQLGHPNAATAVACDPTSPLYLSGSVSNDENDFGRIVLSNNSGPLGAMDTVGSVESIAFSPIADSKLAASGTLAGQLVVWDLTRLTARSEKMENNPRDGFIKVEWLTDQTVLAATLHGRIHGYDVRTLEKCFELLGHRSDIYDFRYVRASHTLLTVSEDHKAKIFDVPPLSQ